MRDQNQPLDYYEILGITNNATHEQIRRAFLNSATEWHIDRNQEPDSKRMVRLIMAAWEILGDSEKRADYDRRLTDNDLDFDRRLIWFRNSLLPRLLENDVDLYEILDVPHDATSGNINVAYHLQQEFIDQDPVLRQNPPERDRVRNTGDGCQNRIDGLEIASRIRPTVLSASFECCRSDSLRSTRGRGRGATSTRRGLNDTNRKAGNLKFSILRNRKTRSSRINETRAWETAVSRTSAPLVGGIKRRRNRVTNSQAV